MEKSDFYGPWMFVDIRFVRMCQSCGVLFVELDQDMVLRFYSSPDYLSFPVKSFPISDGGLFRLNACTIYEIPNALLWKN